MKEQIIEYAKKLNIEFTGIAPVKYYSELEERILLRKSKFGLSSFEENDVKKRVNPLLSFPYAKSIIVCLFPYYTGEDEKSNVSLYARIPDYHKVAIDKLRKICAFINEKNNVRCDCFVDTGVLHDRYLAYIAGLGFWGMNTCLVNEKYGTYFFIGYIVTELSLSEDEPLSQNRCTECGKCVLACPGGALDGNFELDVNRCVSYITQLKEQTNEQRHILQNQSMIYGCDRCQEVCPYNKKKIKTPISEFYKKRVAYLSKEELSTLSNKEFKAKYGDFPFSWRGKNTILKNFDK